MVMKKIGSLPIFRRKVEHKDSGFSVLTKGQKTYGVKGADRVLEEHEGFIVRSVFEVLIDRWFDSGVCKVLTASVCTLNI
ncbi:hypothetical protein R1flu_007615 [Riccia fluitans]|uniref:Uncharacterized protein n=1 Tax=Riccia fluitans TaxID=41844 RepID=A0ABD1YZE1_9MARC